MKPHTTYRVGLDFDGSLTEGYEQGKPLAWRPGAHDFIVGAAAAGIQLIVHTCRATLVAYEEQPGEVEEFYRTGTVPEPVRYSWKLRRELYEFLAREGVLDLVTVWDQPGKPLCDIYADDRGERPDWIRLAEELGVDLAHGQRGSAPLGTSAAVGQAVQALQPTGPVGRAGR